MVAASAGRWFRLRRGARRRDTCLWTPGHLRRRDFRQLVLCRKRHARLDCARRRDFPDLHAGRFAPVFERQWVAHEYDAGRVRCGGL